MQRIPEDELMEDAEQALAYANADFDEPHSMFIRLFQQRFGEYLDGRVIDLGCGTADITVRFAKGYPHCLLDGIDGSRNMLSHGSELVTRYGLTRQIRLIHGCLPGALLGNNYDTVISNSLLHHLRKPMVLWEAIRQYAKPGARLFVMDLHRPQDITEARRLVAEKAADEPEILQRDFYNSLLAAYTVDEIKHQLDRVGLDHLSVNIVTDRHVVISGHL
jgi:ubiquinone/menaquinone biosynthesis C-methylase UbiE